MTDTNKTSLGQEMVDGLTQFSGALERASNFRKVEKINVGFSIPESLHDEFRRHAKALGMPHNKLLTVLLCTLLERDESVFGITAEDFMKVV